MNLDSLTILIENEQQFIDCQKLLFSNGYSWYEGQTYILSPKDLAPNIFRKNVYFYTEYPYFNSGDVLIDSTNKQITYKFLSRKEKLKKL